jgi:hypothetical protein
MDNRLNTPFRTLHLAVDLTAPPLAVDAQSRVDPRSKPIGDRRSRQDLPSPYAPTVRVALLARSRSWLVRRTLSSAST